MNELSIVRYPDGVRIILADGDVIAVFYDIAGVDPPHDAQNNAAISVEALAAREKEAARLTRLKDAIDEGRQACRAGVYGIHNPYRFPGKDADSGLQDQWDRGWSAEAQKIGREKESRDTSAECDVVHGGDAYMREAGRQAVEMGLAWQAEWDALRTENARLKEAANTTLRARVEVLEKALRDICQHIRTGDAVYADGYWQYTEAFTAALDQAREELVETSRL